MRGPLYGSANRLRGLRRLAGPGRIAPSPIAVGFDLPQAGEIAHAAKVLLDRREQPAPIGRRTLIEHALDHGARWPDR